MGTPFLLPFSPHRLEARHPRIIEDLLEVARTHEPAVASATIGMLADLHQNGASGQFVRKLQGLPLFELKTNARGRGKGGARIYFAFTPDGEALVINAEVKSGDAPSAAKIVEATKILLAYRDGHDVGL